MDRMEFSCRYFKDPNTLNLDLQLNFTPEMDVFFMLRLRDVTLKLEKRSLKQHIKYFNFRS